MTSFVGPPIAPLEAEAGPEEAAAGTEPEEPQEVKEFQLDIWPSGFVHEKYIRSPITNPLYGSFRPISPDNSFIGGALKQSVPPSLWAKGLMDWETDDVRRKRWFAGLDAELEGTEDANSSGGRSPNPTAAYLRRQKRRQMKATPRVMLGLRALREEREQKEEEERRQRRAESVMLREDSSTAT